MQNNQLNLRSVVLILATIGMSCCYILPITRLALDVQRIATLTAIFTLFIAADNIANIRKTALFLLGYGTMMFLVARPGDFKYGFLHPMLISWNNIFPAMLAFYLVRRCNMKELSIILLANIVLYGLIGQSTVTMIQESPNIMREMTNGDTDETYKILMQSMNVGGFGFAYGSGAVFLAGLGLILYGYYNKFKVWKMIFLTSLTLFSAYITFNSMFTTLLLLTIIAVGVIVWQRTKNHVLKFLVVVSLASLLFFWKDAIIFLASFYPDSTISTHLYGMIDDSGESSDRTRYQVESLKYFLMSPIWGNNITDSLRLVYIRSHSTALAVAMSTGIIGLIFYYKTFWIHYTNVFKIIRHEARAILWYPLVIFFALLTILNPTTYDEFSWLYLFFIPLLIFYFTYNEKESLA